MARPTASETLQEGSLSGFVPKARLGKSMVAGYFSAEMQRRVKMLAVERGVTVQALIGEGLDLLHELAVLDLVQCAAAVGELNACLQFAVAAAGGGRLPFAGLGVQALDVKGLAAGAARRSKHPLPVRLCRRRSGLWLQLWRCRAPRPG